MGLFLKLTGIACGAWTVMVWCIFFPASVLYRGTIERRELVVATVSEPWVEVTTGRLSRRQVFATVEFERSSPAGKVRCRVRDFQMGADGTQWARAREINLAVHPHSCEDAKRLPWQTSLLDEWFQFYVGLMIAFIGGVTVFFAGGWVSGRTSGAAASAR